MHKFASFNHKILTSSKIYLSAISSAVFYGRANFTTVAIYNSEPFQWEKHWGRLTENALRIGVDLSQFSEEAVKKSLLEIISKNNFKNGRARLTFFDESSNGIWRTENKHGTSLLITAADFRDASNNLRLTVSLFQINSKSALVNVKSCNYLENILALEEAKRRGFGEAVRLNERGEIVSACMANIFWTQGGKIFTPALETGCLEGTTRDFVLKNFSVQETKTNLTELKQADEIFLTSAGISIAKIKSFDEKVLTDEVTTHLQEEFLRRVENF